MRWLYANCEALVCAGFESYGLTPIEAAAFGRPTIALRDGGLTDVVVEGRTGAFFDRAEPASLAAAVRRSRQSRYGDADLRRVADDHAEAVFHDRLRAVVEQELALGRRP